MKISQKAGGMEKTECNNYEIKEVESFKYFGSKIMTDGSFNRFLDYPVISLVDFCK
jgi:hypothetical protein